MLSVQRKLPSFRRETLWASSLRGLAPRTFRLSASLRMNPRRRERFHYLRRQLRFSTIKGVKQKHLRRERRRRRSRRCELSASGLSEDEQSSRTTHQETPQTSDCRGQDDIDDIFASVGLWHWNKQLSSGLWMITTGMWLDLNPSQQKWF